MRIIITILATLALLFAGLTTASATTLDLPACQYEDSTNCYWDAQTQGNGQGQSFYDVDGTTHYLNDVAPTQVAPVEVAPVQTIDAPAATLDDSAAYAWSMFDAVDAASLLPAEGGQVTLIGANTTGFPYLTDDLITVWDLQGNHYLFQIS